MARFDIMHGFYDFYQTKKPCESKPDLGNFVVVRVQCENFEALSRPVEGAVEIKTALTVHLKPLLEFEQIAMCKGEGSLLNQVSMKIAIVDKNSKTVETWDEEILLAMSEFIQTYGKEDII